MKTIIPIIITCITMLCMLSCVSKKDLQTVTDFQDFDKAFAKIELKDTLDSRHTNWALGHSYEITTPILNNELFYSVFDTSKMIYRHWEDRIYAEVKIDLPNNHTGYFVSRQTEDISYDRTTVLVIVDNNNNYTQDFIFSEFIGYEGYVTETQSQLVQDADGFLKVNSIRNVSHYDYEKGKMVKKTASFDKSWIKSGFYVFKSFD